MRAILDTSAFLWFIGGNKKLSNEARKFIESFENELVMSVASLWETAIKISIGKLEFYKCFEVLISEKIEENEIDILQINLKHLSEMMKLPFHHRDPFDRLIIAQGISERIPIITCDYAFKIYPVDIIW